MFQENAKVVDHFTIASKTHLIRLQCPKIASLIRPGQFVMIKLPGGMILFWVGLSLFTTRLLMLRGRFQESKSYTLNLGK